jgi:hypothetical protein
MKWGVRAIATGFALVVLTSCSSPGPPSSQPARPSSPGTPPSSGLFGGSQPWTTDVTGAPASERSTAILDALTRAGGWGNGNVLQVDFAMPVLTADAAPAG